MRKLYQRALAVMAFASVACAVQAQEVTLSIDREKYPQLTDVPTMYIEVDGNKEITTKVSAYDSATIVIVDANGQLKERNERVGIRLRGNSTSSSAKKPYRLKFPSKTALLKKADGTNDFADAKSWTLLANAYDKSMIHNALTYELGKFVGLPFCPCYQFVDLVYNGDYRGTYQISDQVQQDKNRVNIGKDGWLWELTRQSFIDANDSTMLNDGIYAIIKNPDTDDFDGDSLKRVMTPVFEGMVNAINSRDFSESTGYRKYIDVESLIDYYIVMEVSGNYDAWVSNYMYKNAADEKLKFGPVWDCDLCYGNKSGLENILTWENNGSSFQPMASKIRNIFGDPQFVKALNDRWNELVEQGILDFLKAKTDSLASVVAQTQAKNYSLSSKGAAWNVNQKEFDWAGGDVYTSYDASVAAIKTFLDAHVSYMTTRFEAELAAVESAKTTVELNAQDEQYQFNNNIADSDGQYNYTKLNRMADVSIANRTIDGAAWNTICLPFDATREQLEAAFGTEYKLREFTDVEGSVMKFAEPKDKKIIAGVPYLIKLSGAGASASLNFTDVMLTVKVPLTITHGDYSFAGTFWKTTLNTDGTHLFLGAADELYKPTTSGNKIYGMRAYFVVPAGSSAKVQIAESDAETTGISELVAGKATANGAVYSVSGQLVGSKRGSLPKGIYIQDGKKFVVK
ncbi:MAG: CotH kinase family protein [Prevotella sp.]|nr:CotH kinase family protein [Prevotella sp.]